MSSSFSTATVAPTPADWRLQIPEAKRRHLRIWLWSIAGMTLSVLIVGGITRLTQSGLSIVDWQPLMGVIPPVNEAQWLERFELYRQYPEYQRLRQGMSLEEFKFIFFWEYVHRLLARLIGVVFLVPFVVFWLRGYFNRPLALRSIALFALGGAQGLLGWIMVQSGLVDQPSVSHYRLAAHLSLAFIIFGVAVWLARDLDLRAHRPAVGDAARRLMKRGLAVVGVLLSLQIVWGAFVAGLKAGFFYNTFPLMGGRITPPEMLALQPVLRNLVANPAAVQWLHRFIGTVLIAAVMVLFIRVRRAAADPASQRLNVALLATMVTQYLLGVLTLLLVVPVSLGVIHQAAAMLLFGVWLVWVHHANNLAPAAAVPSSPRAAVTAGTR
ncbi:COX15/CtaA family protein [soil metagenome]